jgi:O-antigen/teichoic acid export membrane protein
MHQNKRSLTPSLGANYLFNAALTISNILFPLISFSIVARALGPTLIGKINFAFSFAGYFSLVATLGLLLSGTSVIAKLRDDEQGRNQVVGEFFGLLVLASIGATLLYGGAVLVLGTGHGGREVLMIAGVNIISTFCIVDWFFQGIERYRYIALRNIGSKVVMVIAIIALVHRPQDYLVYALLTVLIPLGANLHGLYKLTTMVALKPVFSGLKKHWNMIAVNSLSLMTVSLYVVLDNSFVGFLAGDTAVGYYSTAMRIVRIGVAMITSLAVVLLPRMSYFFEQHQMDEFYLLVKKAFNYLSLISIPAYCALVALAPDIIRFLAGEAFLEAVVPLRIGAICIPIIALTSTIGMQVLVAMGKLWHLFFSTLAASVLSVILYFLLIPRFGYVGAAVATTTAEATVLLVQLIMLKKLNINLSLRDCRFGNFVLASVLMSGVVIALKRTLLLSPLWLIVSSTLAGGGVYFVTLWLLREPIVLEGLGMVRTRIFRRSLQS